MKKIIFFAVVILIGGILLYMVIPRSQPSNSTNNSDNSSNPLLSIGYTKEQTIFLEANLNDEQLTVVKKNQYIPNLIKLLKNKDCKKENLEKYIRVLINAPSKDVDTVIAEVNRDGKKDMIKNNFKQDPYYIERNFERYLAYYEKKPQDIREVVASVNCNIDYTFYEDDEKTDLSKGNLILVNKYHYLDSSYVPDDLEVIDDQYSQGGSLKRVAKNAFIKMAQAAEKDDYHLVNASPYRSYATQKSLYNRYVNKDGQANADTYSARPGYSEHQTGLALDIATPTTTIDTMIHTKEFTWLKNNAHKYGFILRYPEGKEYLTGYTYEPWHYRYVGVDVATYIYEHDITFEEYYDYFLK